MARASHFRKRGVDPLGQGQGIYRMLYIIAKPSTNVTDESSLLTKGNQVPAALFVEPHCERGDGVAAVEEL